MRLKHRWSVRNNYLAGIVAGDWWPEGYAGPPLASLDAQVDGRLGLTVGDSVTLALASGPVTATIANLRRIDWTRLDLDFPVLLSPFPEPPPHSLIAAAWSPPDAVSAVEAAVAEAVPQAPTIRVAEVLDTLGSTVRTVRGLLNGLSAVALGAAAVVLLGAIANSARRRLHEMAILHALGIGRWSMVQAVVLEFTILGTAVAAVAVPLGWVGGATVVASLADGAPLPGGAVPLAVFVGTIAAMAAVGAVLVARLPRRDVMRRLRSNALSA